MFNIFNRFNRTSIFNKFKKTIILSLLCLFPLSAQKIESFDGWVKEQDQKYPKIKVVFSLEKRDFQVSEPIRVKVTLQNISEGSELLRIQLKKNLFFHFNLETEDSNKRKVDHSIEYLSWRYNQDQLTTTIGNDAFYAPQSLELAYLDTFSTYIDLTRWFDLSKPGIYFLKGQFRPNPEINNEQMLYAVNEISFNVSGQLARLSLVPTPVKGPKQSKNHAHVPPYEVVARFLESEKFREWGDYLNHIHLTSYLANSYFGSEFHERYISSRADETELVLSDFKNFLIQNVDYEVLEFDVLQTMIEGSGAEVAARLKTRSSTESFVKKFDPITGQINFDWYSDKNKKFIEEKILYFKLSKFFDTWKIIEKQVGIVKSKDFKLPPKTIGDIHVNKYKVFGNILFVRQKDIVRPLSEPVLKELIDYLKENPQQKVELKGHTDASSGTFQQQLVLSESRTAKIKALLTEAGINGVRIKTRSFGGTRPVASNTNESTMQFNRRVEVRLLN